MKIQIKKNINTLYLTVYCGWIICSLINAIPLNTFFIYFGYIVFSSMLLFLVYGIDVSYGFSFRKILCDLIIGTAFFASAISTKSWQLVTVFSLFLCAKYADFDQIVKVSLITNLVTTVIIIFFSLIGVIPDYTYMHEGILAHSYGFYYYSNVSYIFLYCIVMFLYLYRGRIRIIHLIGMILFNYIIYRVFTTRLVYYLVYAILAIYIIFSGMDLSRKIWRKLACVIYPLMFAVCVIITYLNKAYKYKKVMVVLDRLLSTRITLNTRALEKYGISLFGHNIPMVGGTDIVYGGAPESSYFFIDSGYMYSLLCYGVLASVILIILFSYMSYSACKNNDKVVFIWLMILAVFMLVNNYWLYVTANPIILYFNAEKNTTSKTENSH